MTSGRKRARAARAFLLALICVQLLALSVSSEDLFARRAADQLHILAPRLHFLTGKHLQRLHDGLSVPFDFHLTISAGSKNNIVLHAFERFTISYDVWEEKFRVVRLGNFRKSGYLSANAAESWCIDNIFLPLGSIPQGKDLWARLEVRSADPKEQAPAMADTGISIATLIELFSRQPRPQQDHWIVESSRFQFADLKP